MLLPALADLDGLRVQRTHLRAGELDSARRLEAYAEFVDALDREDPALIRRLAAAHLNLMPAGETPVLIASSASDTERQWIDATLPPLAAREQTSRSSLLARLSGGRSRLFLLGAGALAIFIGLLLDTFRDVVRHTRETGAPRNEDDLRSNIGIDETEGRPRPRRLAA
jgi:hypothetical protein